MISELVSTFIVLTNSRQNNGALKIKNKNVKKLQLERLSIKCYSQIGRSSKKFVSDS